jgi:hypothetical protein
MSFAPIHPAVPAIRGDDCGGIDHLRCRLELGLVRRHLRGDTVLAFGLQDAGSAAYRGQAMSAHGRLLAPVELQALALPARRLAATLGGMPNLLAAQADAGCDGVQALDLLGRVADWRACLQQWARMLTAGGRLVVDLASLAHAQALPGALDGSAEPAGHEARLDLTEVLAEAAAHGLHAVHLQPYGAFLGGPETAARVRLNTVERFHWWRRLLSWVPQDASLTELALLLDDELVGRLPASAAGRCLLVLEKAEATASTPAAMPLPADRLDEAFQSPALAERVSTLLLASWRNMRYFTAWRDALQTVMPGMPAAALDALATGEARARLADADHRTRLDTLSMDMIRGWRALPEPEALMTLDGVPLADVTDYHMIQMLLIFGFKPFPELAR